jgi:putative endonuclease
MEFFVYILKSTVTERYYIGQTSNLEKRIKRHNFGEMFSTKPYRPWEIIYFEKFSTRSEAMKRERYLKSPTGWNELQNIKQKYNNNNLTH